MSIPVDSTWKLTFDEEFNGNSIDTSVWETNWLGNPGAITKPINSEELAAYDPAQVSVSGGLLHLNLIQSPVTVNGVNYQYRSGIVETHDSFWQTYGYFEARINVPSIGGKIADWPAFWTDGQHWPYDGEMDIMEGLGGTAAYHYHSPSGGPGGTVKGDYTGWHTFGALWEPGKVSYYYDNQLVGVITTGIESSPNYLILNLGLGIHSLASIPAEMQVDWVHVYSLDPSAVAVTPEANYTGPGGNALTLAGGTTSTSGGTTSSTDTYNDIYGTTGNNKLRGTSGADYIVGDAGNDKLMGSAGDDNLVGGTGNDQLYGGTGADILTGGSGADIFYFKSVTESAPGFGNYDTITDFDASSGDIVDLHKIDADTTVSHNQAFDFIGSAAFSHQAGELRYQTDSTGLFFYGDVNGDGVTDFAVRFDGVFSLQAGDFIM
jgi:beta-glucanase (GH16 family)